MDIRPLPRPLTERILRHFGLPADSPLNLATLHALVAGYTRAVPWESASRIVRRARHEHSADCFLAGEAFWQSHLAQGSGGTCYESNYVFFALLRRLGYQGYLTINDMGETIGCHSAIVILHGERKLLVDVGFPLYTLVPILADRETNARCSIMRYSLQAQGDDRYLLRRELGARVHGFLLQDAPVNDEAYRAIGIHDYRRDGGQFLNEVVIHRIVDAQLWRFHSDVQPLCLQQFIDGERIDHALGDDPAAEVTARFGMDQDIVAEAFDLLGIAAGG